MKKVLFLIPTLGGGGAEKVLINLVNHMDQKRFDITVMTLFDLGPHRKNLAAHIHYRSCFKHMPAGNSHMMKVLSPRALHQWLIKDHYDIEVAYLEGPAARIISGCSDSSVKKYAWIHCTMKDSKMYGASFRSLKEAERCYRQFNKIVCVSEAIKAAFSQVSGIKKGLTVLYNTVDSESIIKASRENPEHKIDKNTVNLITVGTLKQVKGYDRLLRISKHLNDEGILFHLFIIGDGGMKADMLNFISDNNLKGSVSLLGFQQNPYKYLASCDLYVCASYSEGFSTSATEAIIVGTPVCTTDVSGMRELLGEHNEYGLITENDEEALYKGIKKLVLTPDLLEHYKKQAVLRGLQFDTRKTVKKVEALFGG